MSADITEQSAPEPAGEVVAHEKNRNIHRGNGRHSFRGSNHRNNRTVGAGHGVWWTMTATAYTADCLGCSGITRTGVDVRSHITHRGRRVIATDPAVIPLGSAVEIRLADGRTIEAVAADVGGGINGREIDVLMATEAEALEFGRRNVEVRIVK